MACSWSMPVLAGPSDVTGSLQTGQGVRVLKLWGTPDQRGHAHGVLLGADLMKVFEGIVLDPRIVDSLPVYESKVRRQLLGRFRFDPDYRAELEGMLRGIVEAVGLEGTRLEKLGRHLDVRDLMALNCMADWYPFACSSFSAWGPATADGQMITARNLDFIPLPGLETDHVLIAYLEPGSGKLPWVSLAWPGLIGAYSAMNAGGVTVSMHDASPLEPTHRGAFVPRSLALRDAIESARAGSAVADVKRVLLKCPTMFGNNIHVSSPYTGQATPAAVFEYDGQLSKDGGVTQRVASSSKGTSWLTCTNHYCRRADPPPVQDHPFSTVRRFTTLATALADAGRSQGKIDPAWARSNLAKVATQGDVLTLHTVYYLPNRKEMLISLTQSGQPATRFEPVRMTLAKLLRK
ncbi:MAG: C45 family autoproteolytic acyltransferase/hydrolase [Phycisphaerae bacterium]